MKNLVVSLCVIYVMVALFLYGESHHYYTQQCTDESGKLVRSYECSQIGPVALFSGFFWPMYLSYRAWR